MTERSGTARHDHPRSRPRLSSGGSTDSIHYVTPVESLILPGGPVGEETAELLEELVGSHQHGTDPTLLESDEIDVNPEDDDDDDDELEKRNKLPWWKRPSPYWILCVIPFSAIAKSATLAPTIELYTMLVCRAQKPDIFHEAVPQLALGNSGYNSSMPNTFIARRSGHAVSMNAASPLTSFIQPNYVSLFMPKPAALVQRDVGDEFSNQKSCASDPVVQAAVAKLSALVTTSMGLLSLLTTGWWGSFSDRHGRTSVMGISLIGLLLTELNFIAVYFFTKYMPGGYYFLIVGPIIEGLLGGFSSAVAAIHAYLADTTTETTRARIFSLNLGLLFAGMAIGPMLGGLIIRFTGYTISAFFFSATSHIIYAIFIWLVLPESRWQREMKRSRLKHEGSLRAHSSGTAANPAIGLDVRMKKFFRFLSPLAVFLPDVVESRNPLKTRRKDWNLTLLAVGYGCGISLMGSASYTFQYASSTFSWSSEMIGYWLSLIGAGRAIFLTIVLPIAIKFFKPKPLVIEIPSTHAERQPLLPSRPNDPTDDASGSRPRQLSRGKPIRKEIHSPAFELGVAQFSVVVDILAYSLMGLAPTGTAFLFFGMLGAMGIGFSPAVQTCTLAVYAKKGGTETGKLFGALSVVQALGGQILGPALYGFVYVASVTVWPRALFFAVVTLLTISLVLFSLVRLPNDAELQRDILDAYHHADGDLEEQSSEAAEESVFDRERALVDDR